MDFFLEDGQLAGKIICPNKKCAAKLGNYDWAGACCSCKEWVVPVRIGFSYAVLAADHILTGLLHSPVQSRRDCLIY